MVACYGGKWSSKDKDADREYIKTVDYQSEYERSLRNPESFWSYWASRLEWDEKWERAYVPQGPLAKWFVKGLTNIALNSLGKGKSKLVWYSEAGKRIELGGKDLERGVKGAACRLKEKGVSKEDRVAIYGPNSILTLLFMLGSAWIGAVYSVIFAGLGEEAVKARLDVLKPRVLIKARKTERRGKAYPLYFQGDIEYRLKEDEEEVAELVEAGESCDLKHEPVEANSPLKVFFTSGTTGTPKGIMLPHGAWMVGDYAVFDYLFSLKENEVVFTTADVGWITFSRIMYGTLLHGGTFVFMEGAPEYPRQDKIRNIAETEGAKVFFTSPTLLRLFRKLDAPLGRTPYLAAAGEIFDEPSWHYAMRFSERVTDVYGQTELGYVIGTPYSLDGVEARPGFAGVPLPGAELAVLDETGKPTKDVGYLVAVRPFPTQFIGVLNDENKFKQYFARYGYHDTGDMAIVDGLYFKIVGRSDDMIKVAGHRITSGEVEAVIAEVKGVSEVAAVGVPDEVKGNKLVIFYVGDAAEEEIRRAVREKLGPIYVVDAVYRVKKLPRSRSGKIMRSVLRKIVTGEPYDPTVLEDPKDAREIEDVVRKGVQGSSSSG